MQQGNIEGILTFSFVEDKILSMTMMDPDLFTFEPINMRAFFLTPVLDDNKEPLAVMEGTEDKRNQEMTRQDFFAFAVQEVKKLLEKSNIEVISTHGQDDDEYPNVVTIEDGQKTYYKVASSLIGEPIERHPKGLKGFLAFCEDKNVVPKLLNIAMYCLDDFEGGGRTPFYGAYYAMKIRVVAFK
jgi:hypothetical protein